MGEQLILNEVAFSQPVINIGSDRDNDITLSGASVSRFHIMLSYESPSWMLVPLDPNARTLLNDRAIDPAGCVISSGAILTIGDYRLKLSLNGVNADIIVEKADAAEAAAPANAEDFSGRNILLAVAEGTPTETEAGSSVEYELTVTNAGPLVANMQLQLQGIPANWVQIIPPVLNLNEGRKGTFIVRVTPPRSHEAQAGLYQLHFVAISPNYPTETATVNTVLTVLPYSDFLAAGPMPRRVSVSRRHPEELTDITVSNNSNAPATFMVRASDDANELLFSYMHDEESLVQGQDTVTVEPGGSARVPIRVGARRRPLLGITSHLHHYYANVTPIDHPGDTQSLLGEVSVRPMIHTGWLLLLLLLLALIAVAVFQPYITEFSGVSGKRTDVILAGNSLDLKWRVSPFASTVTLDDGTGPKDVAKNSSEFVTPSVSTTYTLKSENFLSRLFPLFFTHERKVRVLTIPNSPAVNVFSTDKQEALFEQDVQLSWSVSANADRAAITANKQDRELKPEEFSGNETAGYKTDTLFSLKAENDSGYEMKSLFLNVHPDQVDLVKFIAWVRPSGIAIPENNDVRRSTRWSSLQLGTNPIQPETLKPAGGNAMPAPQSSVLQIPDNYMDASHTQVNMNPEQRALSGSANLQNYGYEPVSGETAPEGLLVSPSLIPTPTPPVVEIQTRVTLAPTAVPATSPEAQSSARDFSVKLVEVVEDPAQQSGYRTIDYFPGYVLQKGEQVLIEWAVEGVPNVKIDNLSSDTLTASGTEFIFPEKSTNLVLNGEVGAIKKAYTMPIEVAGDPDDGEDSGTKCELKANATSLTVPGTVMLTWTNGGSHRVQLISSAKAESDSEKAEEQKAKEAKEKGESYTTPENNPMTGGIIGDYLQPSGFMRVNVDKQTTFILNAYDANGKVICTKNAVVNFAGGNDKKDLKLAITKIADENNVSQSFYTVGQTVMYTVNLSGYEKGKNPTGTITVTDGFSACSMTWPVNHCSLKATQTGDPLKVTAVYSGDDTYKKKTDTDWETVIEKIDTVTDLKDLVRVAADKVNFITEVQADVNDPNFALAEENDIDPTGTITFTSGSGTCVLTMDILNPTLSCDGSAKFNLAADPHVSSFEILKMLLSDTAAKSIRAKYSGDNYFNPSQSAPVEFTKIHTETKIENVHKYDVTYADLTALLTPDEYYTDPDGNEIKPTGTIKFTIRDGSSGSGGDVVTGTCILNIEAPYEVNCEGTAAEESNGEFSIEHMLLADKTADRIKAEYSGDSLYDPSESTIVLFDTIQTILTLEKGIKATDNKISLTAVLALGEEVEDDEVPTGTVTFTSGGATCTLNLDTGMFEKCSGTFSPNPLEIDADHKTVTITVTDMAMNGTPGDSIYAEYSGDSLYTKSTSPSLEFNKNAVTLKILDDKYDKSGKKHGWFTPEQEILIEVELSGYAEGIEPTGEISITGSGITCTAINWESEPSHRLKCKLPATEGDLAIIASYAGNSFYSKTTADGSVTVKEKQPLKITITEITDLEGVSQGEYFKEEEIYVSAELSGYDENELPDGNITVTIGSSTATCEIPDPFDAVTKCKLKTPVGSGDLSLYDVTAKYNGNTYYLTADAETVPIKVANKYGIDLEITQIVNDKYIEQPYYVVDGDTGQDVWVFAALSNGQVGLDPVGQITIFDDLHRPLCSYTWPTQLCKFNVKSLDVIGTETLTAHYDGDTNYVQRDAEKDITVQKIIPTELYIQHAHKMLKDNLLAEVDFEFRYDPALADQYGVSPEIDETYTNTEEDWDHGIITLSFSESEDPSVSPKKCEFDLYTETLDAACEMPGTVVTKEVSDGTISYHITDILTGNSLADEVKAEYNGNRYFSASDYGPEVFGVEDQGLTTLIVSEAVRLGHSYAFFNATLEYDADVAEKYSARPSDGIGKLTLTPIGGSSPTCVYDFETESSEYCPTLKIEKTFGTGGDGTPFVAFEISGMVISGGTTGVNIRYGSDEFFMPDDDEPELTEEPLPEIDISYAVSTGENTSTVSFTVSGIGKWAKKYNVFDQLRASVSTDGTSWKTKYSFDFPNGGSDVCSGTVSGNDDGYMLEGWSVSFDPSYFTDAQYVQLELRSSSYPLVNNESPVDQEQFGLETEIDISDLLKARSYYFLDSDLSYDSETLPGRTPAGTIRLTFLREDGTVYPTQQSVFEYSLGDASSAGHIETVIKGEYVQWGPVQVYAEYLGDGYFRPCKSETKPFTVEADPKVSITHVVKAKTDQNYLYGIFKFYDIGTLWQKYEIVDKFRLRTSPTGLERIVSYPSLAVQPSSWVSQDAGNVTKIDDTTYMINGLALDNGAGINSDTYLVLLLGDQYSISNHIAGHIVAQKDYTKSKTEFNPLQSVSFRIVDNHAFIGTEFHILGTEARNYYEKEPSGTITFTAGSSTCTYTLPQKFSESDRGSWSGCEGYAYTYMGSSTTQFSLRVKNWSIPSGVESASITYSGDGFYESCSNSVNLPDKTPKLTIKTAEKNTSSSLAKLVFTVENYYGTALETEYHVFPHIYLTTSQGSTSAASTLIKDKQLFTDSFSGSLSISGNQFTINGLGILWGAQTFYKDVKLELYAKDDLYSDLSAKISDTKSFGVVSSFSSASSLSTGLPALSGSPISLTLQLEPPEAEISLTGVQESEALQTGSPETEP